MLDVERLREVLHYDASTGEFRWRVNLGTRARAGELAGYLNKQTWGTRHIIKFDGGRYYAHRLAWLYVHGEWPDHQIDHKNLGPTDNALENLRPATNKQNQGNTGLLPQNTSGYKGVSWNKRNGRWIAYIHEHRVRKHLGYFDTAEAAHQAYATASTAWFGEFARP